MSFVVSAERLIVDGVTTGLSGTVEVPGDKSISHRALLLGGIAHGTTRIRNFLPANDCIATLEVVRALGVPVEYDGADVLVHGGGVRGLEEARHPLDCGGSGTTMRLLAGLLAGQPFYSVLAANAQLSRRPMDRVAAPLRLMGATILGREGGKYAPLTVQGSSLHGITYSTPVASAQVKSALLLAGLYAEGTTTVVEPTRSRDHTERMLAAMGAALDIRGNSVSIEPATVLQALDVSVPGDISSAAFLLAAGAVVPGSRVTVRNVGMNPGRTGVLDALRRMGANLGVHNAHTDNGEPVADLELAYQGLTGTSITAEDVPGMIDELPVLAVIATQAQGVTEVRGASELRVKETDRISTIVSELRRMGAHIEALPDGFVVQGPVRLNGAAVSSHGDHRLAMSLAVAGLCATGETVVEDVECINDSFPGFGRSLARLLDGQRRGAA